jgi:hypothetical protein
VTVSEYADHAVARQVRAWNAGDLEAFLLCFAEDVVVEDADGNVQSTGRNVLRTTRVWLRPSRPAFVHAPGGTVVHANGAEGGLHRLVEAQHDPARSTGEHLVVRRRRRDEDRVRRRRRRCE